MTTTSPDTETRVRRATHRIVGLNPAHIPCLHPMAYGYLLRKLCTGTPRVIFQAGSQLSLPLSTAQ